MDDIAAPLDNNPAYDLAKRLIHKEMGELSAMKSAAIAIMERMNSADGVFQFETVAVQTEAYNTVNSLADDLDHAIKNLKKAAADLDTASRP